MNEWMQIIVLTMMAGIAMPIGAAISGVERILPRWLETDFRHSVTAFGGGALLAAVALVLVPDGVRNLPPLVVVVCFAAGGIAFMILDIRLAARATPASQLLAMISDFIPEAMALGATFLTSNKAGFLLAGIIALQNLPEGFNACREVTANSSRRVSQVVVTFFFMALLGPIAGIFGYLFLAERPEVVSGVMLFSAGGILYLIFQDIAPQAKLEKHWAPPLGAVGGFLLGVLGKMAIGS